MSPADSSRVQFNPLKHHLGYIRSFISSNSLNDLVKGTVTIGNSQMDLYTGLLDPTEIIHETGDYLEGSGVGSMDKFSEWIWHNRGFVKMDLSDGSSWILRLGDDPARYIHIHPARYSHLSRRVKSTTLKVAILACKIFPASDWLSDEDIDLIRTKYLGMNRAGRSQGRVFEETVKLLKGTY